MKWETPARSPRSSAEPAPIQKPSETERTLGTFSEITRSPESSSDRTYFCTARRYSVAGSGHELEAGAVALGLVERGVGQPEQGLRVAGVLRAGGDSEARVNALDLVRDTRERCAGIALRRLGKQQRELVSADAKRLVALPHRRLQRVCERMQRLVARSMAEAVVQLLEAVEIAEHERQGMAVTRRARNLAVEPFHEGAPVEQARQGIVVGEEAQFVEVRGRD